jgi:hypothetical protein
VITKKMKYCEYKPRSFVAFRLLSIRRFIEALNKLVEPTLFTSEADLIEIFV